VHDFVRDMKSHGYEPTGAAIVVSSLVDGADVCGTHARAHAEEANLYRDVVEHALTSSGLDVAVFLDQALRRDAVEQLGDDAFVDTTLKRLSRVVGTPWRAPEKNASLAAWLILPAARRR
jgi:hypothetical protein